ncbi:helix-turn-helix transcriptional regulator [Kribbella sp. VKM Ac-2571]|nr:helix-turn-helix transcriptional regulator [Kribbella sp. VKM Ac-2571]
MTRSQCQTGGTFRVVFQHLVGGPVMISTLAEQLGVTQQAASTSVA